MQPRGETWEKPSWLQASSQAGDQGDERELPWGSPTTRARQGLLSSREPFVQRNKSLAMEHGILRGSLPSWDQIYPVSRQQLCPTLVQTEIANADPGHWPDRPQLPTGGTKPTSSTVLPHVQLDKRVRLTERARLPAAQSWRFTMIRRHLLSFWAPQHPRKPSTTRMAPMTIRK